MATRSRTGAAAGHAEPNYLGVIAILAIMTAAEIGVVFAPLPRLGIGFLLVGLALSKACMVALFFMHLKFEKITLALIAATPLVLCTMLMFALLPDNNPERYIPPVAQVPVQTDAPATH